MKQLQRLTTIRENLLNIHPWQLNPSEITALDLLLHLTFAADAVRDKVYRPIQDVGLSEAKLLLLATLKKAGGSMSLGMLARQLGVTDATTSIMLSRMLKESDPLVQRSINPMDRRAVTLSLTDKGEETLRTALPNYFKQIADFSETLTQAEQLLLIGLLQKLLKPAA